MTVIASPDLIAELDHVLKAGSPDHRTRMLREVAGLFLEDAHRLNEHHVGLFDDILVRLTESVELRTLTTLSRSLADLRLVPRELARRLANHDDADVAAPILRKCDSIPNADLIDIAWMRAEGHLCAIAGRKAVNQELTDILLMRGDGSVLRALAENPGAELTSAGFAMMVDAAERDDSIADALISRADLPHRVLADLVMRSTPRQQARLLKRARPDIQDAIRAAIDAGAARASAKPPATIDYAEARATVMALNKSGQLNDSSVNRFAIRQEVRNLVAALAQLASVPIETIAPLMEAATSNALVIACRASRLNWNTTAAIVSYRKAGLTVAPDELERARQMFEGLPLSNAQRMIRFGSLSELTAKPSAKV
ncbi:DUF2336 domain-containing protein [Bradyrhizobium septentrionale]|uniref:DUF2336 domain-containing protein n=1 Tax=Bradyrhizobium septentrionale TaxID=1404411 RepID=A0A973W0H9_9BRAD|nr:DUF2336 domain-containing protein [Bradyrhizobium septentrionale]UGY14009.1 DUF2336 domain-containing protein [Bradyrhizobium septentrionale]UGY22564.1 DUF2336 domain-containing protein [Bradyrhizobium septentrionale]